MVEYHKMMLKNSVPTYVALLFMFDLCQAPTAKDALATLASLNSTQTNMPKTKVGTVINCPRTCICSFTDIRTLRVSFCRSSTQGHLTYLFNSYPNLTSLQIFMSDLSTIPHELETLTQLISLDLSRNDIGSVSCDLSKLSNLSTLDLSNNLLQAFPCNLSALANLTSLDLSDNNIMSVPCDLSALAQLTSIDLSHNNITSFPCELATLSRLTSLDLSYNDLKSMACGLLNLTHLTTLDLSNNNIKAVCDSNDMCTFPYDLSTLTQIRTLDFSHNAMHTVPCHLLTLSTLISLDLSDNKIESLECKLSNLTQLTMFKSNSLVSFRLDWLIPAQITSLDISNNKIKSVPCSLNSLSEIVYLNMRRNQIRSFQCNLSNLTQLSYLDLSQNRIESVLYSLSQLRNLTSLHVGDNNLHRFPHEISTLTQLTFLDLSGNMIKVIPDFLSTLTKLTKVNLRKNDLSAFPCVLSNLIHLSSVDLSSNNIKAVPCDLSNLTKLNVLDLSWNEIESNPQGLSHLTRLTSLNLEQNALHTFPCDIATLSQINHVDLSQNDILSVPCDLSNLTQLISLDLSHNKIKSLDSWPLSLAKNGKDLQKLNLDKNHISRFTNHAGTPATSCNSFRGETISLKYNNITHFMDILYGWNIKISTYKDLYNCFKTMVDGIWTNPMTCDCVDYDLYRILQHVKFFYYPLRCKNPQSLWYKDPLKVALDKFICNTTENCPEGCRCVISPFHQSIVVNCDHYESTILPNVIPKLPDQDFWFKLDFHDMNLTEVTQTSYLPKVKRANLSHNSISQITISALLALQNVSSLSLDQNRLQRLPENITTVDLKNIIDLRLGKNPWVCDCKALDTRNWMITYKNTTKDIVDITCQSPPHMFGNNMIYSEDFLFCPNQDSTRENVIRFGAVSATLIILICVILFVMMKVRKWYLKKQLQERMAHLDDVNAHLEFDVFVSYAHEDEDYILDDFIPQLENHNFKVCLHKIHFLGGNTIIDNISECINNSRRTLVYFSNFYKDSRFCLYEFKEALNKDVREGTTRLIAIKDTDLNIEELDDSTRAYFEKRTYIEKESDHFWEHLLHSLPKKQANEVFEIQEEEEL